MDTFNYLKFLGGGGGRGWRYVPASVGWNILGHYQVVVHCERVAMLVT